MFKVLKKIISPTSAYEEDYNILKPAHIYKEFNMILLDVFDQRVIPFIEPDKYENGVLYVTYSFPFMEALHDRKGFFIEKLQEKFDDEIITDVIFVLQK